MATTEHFAACCKTFADHSVIVTMLTRVKCQSYFVGSAHGLPQSKRPGFFKTEQCLCVVVDMHTHVLNGVFWF